MPKKIAVLIRGRQGEALRMSVGLTLVDDIIHVYVLDDELEQNEQNRLNIELMKDMEMCLYSNNEANRDAQILSLEEVARKLTGYDHVLAY